MARLITATTVRSSVFEIFEIQRPSKDRFNRSQPVFTQVIKLNLFLLQFELTYTTALLNFEMLMLVRNLPDNPSTTTNVVGCYHQQPSPHHVEACLSPQQGMWAGLIDDMASPANPTTTTTREHHRP